MNIRITLIIFTVLAAMRPCLHAGAGYIFHSHTTPSIRMPLDAYISSMLPDGMRAPKEHRDELYKFKKIMGIKTPVIVKSEGLGAIVHASAQNVGLPYLRYSIIRLNKDSFQRCSSAFNTQALAHEMAHVKNNHEGINNAIRIFNRNFNQSFKMYTEQEPGAIYREARKQELEAETDGVACLAQCGYAHIIKENLDHYKLLLKNTFHFITADAERKNLQNCSYAQWPEEQLNAYLDNAEVLVTKTREEWQADIEKMLIPKEKNNSSSWFNLERWKIKDPAGEQWMRSEYASSLAFAIYDVLQRHPLGDNTRPYVNIYPTLEEAITYTSQGLKGSLDFTSTEPKTI